MSITLNTGNRAKLELYWNYKIKKGGEKKTGYTIIAESMAACIMIYIIIKIISDKDPL